MQKQNLGKLLTLSDAQNLPIKAMSSEYFDHAMGYHGTQFQAIDLSELLIHFGHQPEIDGILLDCFDDYEGFISLEEIHKYDLYLAIRFKIKLGFEVPNWLKPMLILVPDGKRAPNIERFLAANIRSLRFVRSSNYYAPIQSIAGFQPNIRDGIREFKDNCLTCHSIGGVGGNKGTMLLDAYEFSQAHDRKRFVADFLSSHYVEAKENFNKLTVEQFIKKKQLKKISFFLTAAQEMGKPKN